IPSTPYDAKGLLISAIEDDDPVLFLEPKKIYRAIKQDVPEKLYRIKIGKASVLQEGEQLTLIAYGAMIKPSQQAIQMAKKEGYSIELIDLRTIFPLDKETVIASVKKTGRMVVVHEAPRSFGVGAELMALANEDAFLYLEAPPTRVTGADTIVPLPKGEDLYFPDAERIFDAIRKTIKF
ncbi:MAG TPA: alpha-ketoacid dehydrogenase subunit beta, partial [candidate division Zixibacteria bacterium]|nr:alpha-ketoacid dehydrogenase subunit beta [candidate division Zixibacteria bacterium]